MTKKRDFYFAYGSNLDVTQMLMRCPSAKFIGKAVLKNYRLEIRKHMDIDNVPGATVEGVVYSMTKEDIAVLDRYEGVPFSYNKLRVTVKVGNLIVPNVVTYMKNKANIQYILPTKVYYNRVLGGLKFWSLDTTAFHKAYKKIRKVAKQHQRKVTPVYGGLRNNYINRQNYDYESYTTADGQQYASWSDYCNNYDRDEEAFYYQYQQYKAQRRGVKHYQELYTNPKNDVSETIDLG
jgi:hypothetical protein